MSPASRSVVLVFSLGAGLALALGFWVQGDRARAEQRHDLWLAYERGPIALYVQGSREGAQVLAVHPDPAQRRALADAIQDLDQAWIQAGTLKPALEAYPSFGLLGQAVPWLGSTLQLAEAWPKLESRSPDQIAAARAAAEALRRRLSLLLSQVWEGLSQDPSLDWTPAERVESEAALQALARPLPQKGAKKTKHLRRRGHKAKA